ncbi:hypothetical protein AVEN_241511-1 [Araneus ventricosus]|uniref:Uncharacterized protein n=1 Tax=Araneus ventricosus TaxID=182803 RepID=A0A4Y2RBF4_ARAVE|nr:hypothetical protein AVEN_241511-1 [Araneus ventricosus]
MNVLKLECEIRRDDRDSRNKNVLTSGMPNLDCGFSDILDQVVKIRQLPIQAIFEPAHSKIEAQQATTGVESAATELEVVGCSSESPTKAAYKRKVAELGDIIEKKSRVAVIRFDPKLLLAEGIRVHSTAWTKKGVSKQNTDLYLKFMHKANAYILSLKESRGGLPILESRRKLAS